jgi:hypothetical protein
MINFFWAAMITLMVATTSNFAVTTGAFSQSSEAAASKKTERISGGSYVYLLRGLLNVFSLGMDDLAAKLQSRGISAGVYEYGNWESLCDDVAARYRAGIRPIILVGHSLGADAVIYMSNRLGQMGVPVALIVAFDPVHPVPLMGSTTAHFINYYQSDNGWGRAIPHGSGFKGELSNIDLRKNTNISHTSIDKSAILHTAVIGRVLAIVSKGSGEKSGSKKTFNSGEAPKQHLPSNAAPASSAGVALRPPPDGNVRPSITPAARPAQMQ